MAGGTSQSLPATLQQLASLGGRQGFALMLAAATAVALLMGAWMWSQTPDYRVLFSNISDRDGGAIVAALQQMNVPYQFTEGGGAILVPADKVHEARLTLAAQGLPKGSLVGFELMEQSKFGTSQFLEQVNYQRALEGELARSIQTIAAVQSARVHLAIPKPSVFVREQQKPSASVILNLHPSRGLEPGQTSAIVHLVSSSVPELAVSNVTLVDQNGNLLSSGGGMVESPLDPGQLKYVRELEQAYSQRIEAILAPVVGAANVRASVTAEVDFSQTEHAEELYKPNQTGEAAVRSLQSREAASGGAGPQAGGVPGALTNQPPATAAAPITGAAPAQAASAAAAPATVSTQKDSAVNYEVDKTIRHTRLTAGAIKRLSVAVVVNQRRDAGAKGKPAFRPRSEAEMAQLTNLVRQAMGYTEARGDSVTVANAPFTVEEEQPAAETPLWKQPAAIVLAKEIGKHLLIAVVVLVVFLRVLRPLFRSLMAAASAVPAIVPGTGAGEALPRGAPRYERSLDSVKQLARQEPKLVANIVSNWVSGDER